jgi:hypothetical protein
MSEPLKDFVCFRSALRTGTYPEEAKPLAEALSHRLQASGIAVDQIQRHWEDLRLVCWFHGQLFRLDLTTYVEAQPLEFSLEIRPSGRLFLAWFHRSQIRSIIERVDQILHSDPAFTEIRWHRSRDVAKRASGTEHPFARGDD